MTSLELIRDAKAKTEANITDSVTFEKESDTAQLRLEPPQALTGPKIVLEFLDARTEVELEDAHVDMLRDFIHTLDKMEGDENG